MSFKGSLTGVGIVSLAVLNFLLIPGSNAGQKEMTLQEARGARAAPTVADCSFAVNPARFLQASTRRRQAFKENAAAFRGQSESLVRAPSAPSEESLPLEKKNFIDDFIFDRMDEDDIPRAVLSTDQEFLRRVMLDLTGRIPSPEELRLFLADPSPGKRDKKVDDLLASPEFVDRWTMWFGDLLKNTANSSNVRRENDGRNAFYNYIKKSLQDNKPYNLMAKELIGSNGDSFVNGEVNFIVGGTTPMGPSSGQDTFDTLAVQATTTFLGINNFDCLFCHSGAGHLNALSLWGTQATRMDAWKLGAYFSRVQMPRTLASQPGQPQIFKYTVSDKTTGNYLLNTTSGNRTPRQPQGNVTSVNPEYVFNRSTPPAAASFRVSLAESLTADSQFARAAANYIWAELMGLGIVDPPDSFDLLRQDPDNPPAAPWLVQPSHPDLLSALANQFIKSNYDLRGLMRLITQSTAYQIASRFEGEWNEAYTSYFARKLVRRLDAEMLHDAIAKATGIFPSYTVSGFAAPVQWAMQLPDPSEPASNGTGRNFLNIFLRGNRDTNLRSGETSILQAMYMMNDSFLMTRVHNTNAGSLVNRLIAQKKTDAEVIDELFLATLSRFPRPDEKTAALKSLAVTNKTAAIEDLQWVLLNKVDFIFNY